MSYEYIDQGGDRLVIESTSSIRGYAALTVFENFMSEKPHRAAVYLPSDAEELERFIQAVLDNAGCKLGVTQKPLTSGPNPLTSIEVRVVKR